jgi:hypothetical protein
MDGAFTEMNMPFLTRGQAHSALADLLAPTPLAGRGMALPATNAVSEDRE